MELMATHSDASKCRKQISSFAKTLTVRVATYLAKEIASLFRPVLYHPLMSLTEDDTLPLLTSEFWVRPVYEELLHAASGEDLAEGASFWHAFLTPFWGPETIVIFKRNYVEAMCGLSQIQDKPSKSFDQNQPDITFGKRSSPKHKRP